MYSTISHVQLPTVRPRVLTLEIQGDLGIYVFRLEKTSVLAHFLRGIVSYDTLSTAQVCRDPC